MSVCYYSILTIIGTEDKNSWSSMFSMLGQLFFLILIFILVLALAYYLTRCISSLRYKTFKKSNIKIIESIPLGNQGLLQIVQIGEKKILIGITKENINYICDVDISDIEDAVNEISGNSNPFQKYLNNFMKKNDKK